MEENKPKEIKSAKTEITIIAIGMIILLIIIAVLAIFGNNRNNTELETNTYAYTKEDGTQINNSEELKKVKVLDGLTIQITSLMEHNNYTRILGKVLNTTQETLGGYDIQCVLLDKDGKEMARIDGFIPVVEPGQSGDLNCSVIGSYADAYNINIVRK